MRISSALPIAAGRPLYESVVHGWRLGVMFVPGCNGPVKKPPVGSRASATPTTAPSASSASPAANSATHGDRPASAAVDIEQIGRIGGHE